MAKEPELAICAKLRARELLAQAHEPRKYLVAVDLRNGNIGRQGVAWVETEIALSAIETALRSIARDNDSHG